MGVQGLLSHLRENGCGDNVDIAEECSRSLKERSTRNTSDGSKNILVVDGNGLARHLCDPKSLDWSRGGQWHGIRLNVLNFVTAFAAVNIELHIVWDGTSSASKRSARRTRYCQRVRDATKAVVSFTENEARFHDERLVLPPSFLSWMKVFFRDVGVTQFTARDEGDKAAVLHCFRVNAIGILADDSDFIIFKIPRLFLMETMRYRNLHHNASTASATLQHSQERVSELIRPTATVLRISDVQKVLDIPPQLYPLFSCLVGNDYIASIKLTAFHTALIEYGAKRVEEIEDGRRQQHLIAQVLQLVRGTADDSDTPSIVVQEMLDQRRSSIDKIAQAQSHLTLLQELHQKSHWPDPVYDYHEGRAPDLSNVYVCAVLTGDCGDREWHTGEFFSSKKLAKHSAAKAALESNQLVKVVECKSTMVDEIEPTSTTFSPEIEQVLRYVFTISGSSSGGVMALRSAIRNALKEFDVTDARTDIRVAMHPRLASATTVENVPDVLAQHIERCAMSASTWKVLAYGKLDHGTVLHFPFPVMTSLHQCNYYMDSLRLRRVCYGLLLAAQGIAGDDNAASTSGAQGMQFIEIFSPPRNWESTGLYIVETLDKAHVAHVAPLYLCWHASNRGCLTAEELVAERAGMIANDTPADQDSTDQTIALHAFLVGAGIESQADSLWMHAFRSIESDRTTAAQHTVFCLVARTLLRSTSGLSTAELTCLLAHYVLLQHAGVGALTATWGEELLPPVSANGVWLAGRYQYTLNKMLWLHELCGLPLQRTFTIERLFDGRLLHALHHVLCLSAIAPNSALADIVLCPSDRTMVAALRDLVCNGTAYTTPLTPLAQSVRDPPTNTPFVHRQAAEFLVQIQQKCPDVQDAATEAPGAELCQNEITGVPLPTFMSVGDDPFTFSPRERDVVNDTLVQPTRRSHDHDARFDFTHVVKQWKQTKMRSHPMTGEKHAQTKALGAVQTLHVHLSRDKVDLKQVEYTFDAGRNADGSNFYVCTINIKPRRLSLQGPACSSKKSAKDATCQQVLSMLTANAEEQPMSAPTGAKAGAFADTAALAGTEAPGSPGDNGGMERCAIVFCVAAVAAMAVSVYIVRQRLRRV
eukprot:m.378673 g.378673  ORF g.378673 m.378673 type:complete len:1099 (-) comp20936_c0_seq1:463-3759(-)